MDFIADEEEDGSAQVTLPAVCVRIGRDMVEPDARLPDHVGDFLLCAGWKEPVKLLGGVDLVTKTWCREALEFACRQNEVLHVERMQQNADGMCLCARRAGVLFGHRSSSSSSSRMAIEDDRDARRRRQWSRRRRHVHDVRDAVHGRSVRVRVKERKMIRVCSVEQINLRPLLLNRPPLVVNVHCSGPNMRRRGLGPRARRTAAVSYLGPSARFGPLQCMTSSSPG